MSTLRNPVGPQPPSVYWRRRLLVLIGILAVVVVVILIVARPGSGSGTPGGNPSNSANPSNSPSPGATDDATGDPGDPCDPSVIKIEPITDSDSYPPGVQPMLSMAITNTGAATCSFEVGTGAQEYLIMSGSDRIWSSKDCQTAPTTQSVPLEPGVPQSTTPFPWDRTRSSADTCTGERPEAIGGGATYRLSVKLGEVESEGDHPFILQ
jgi:hypothetical protein